MNPWKLINVSVNAVNKHVSHGDAQPGDPVPGMPDFIFDDNCVPVGPFACIDGNGRGLTELDLCGVFLGGGGISHA